VAAGLSLAAGRVLALASTPSQTRGPFYPYDDALESDADLVQVGGRDTLARGVITHLSGAVKDHRGRPVPGAVNASGGRGRPEPNEPVVHPHELDG